MRRLKYLFKLWPRVFLDGSLSPSAQHHDKGSFLFIGERVSAKRSASQKKRHDFWTMVAWSLYRAIKENDVTALSKRNFRSCNGSLSLSLSLSILTKICEVLAARVSLREIIWILKRRDKKNLGIYRGNITSGFLVLYPATLLLKMPFCVDSVWLLFRTICPSRRKIVCIRSLDSALTFDTSIGWHCFAARCPACPGKIVHSRSICGGCGGKVYSIYDFPEKKRNCST